MPTPVMRILIACWRTLRGPASSASACWKRAARGGVGPLKEDGRMKAWQAAIGRGLLLAGCEDGAPEQNVTQVRAANPFSDQLKGMSELYRNCGLRRAILDSGSAARMPTAPPISSRTRRWRCGPPAAPTAASGACSSRPTATSKSRQCRHARRWGCPNAARLPPGRLSRLLSEQVKIADPGVEMPPFAEGGAEGLRRFGWTSWNK